MSRFGRGQAPQTQFLRCRQDWNQIRGPHYPYPCRCPRLSLVDCQGRIPFALGENRWRKDRRQVAAPETHRRKRPPLPMRLRPRRRYRTLVSAARDRQARSARNHLALSRRVVRPLWRRQSRRPPLQPQLRRRWPTGLVTAEPGNKIPVPAQNSGTKTEKPRRSGSWARAESPGRQKPSAAPWSAPGAATKKPAEPAAEGRQLRWQGPCV